VFYYLSMSSTFAGTPWGDWPTPVEELLAGLLATLETHIVEALESDFAQPAREPDEKAQRLAAAREARAAAARAELESRFVASSDSSRLWAQALGLVDPAELEDRAAAPGLIADLGRVDREAQAAIGRRYAAIAAIAGPRDPKAAVSSESDRHIAHEIGVALGISKDSAQHQISQARALFGEFAPFGQALLAGEVSDWHVRTLISECVNVTDPETRVLIGRLALPSAMTKVVAEFRTDLAALIAELDPEAIERRRTAHQGRHVYSRRGKDGMSFLGLTHDTPVIDAIMATLTADGQAIQDQRARDNDRAAAADLEPVWDDADLRADAARADALMARILGTVTPDGEITFDRAAATAITTEIVIDLDTLRGLADHVALVNAQPAPAGIARDLAAWSTFIRRVVVDPVDGHLLDYGDKTYLPPALRRYCFARDDGCRSPGCTRRAHRLLQLDHALEYPHGPTSAANCGPLCTECHQRKTAGLLDITDSRADGSATFHTAFGQTVRIPARPYLPPPPQVQAVAVQIEQPPF